MKKENSIKALLNRQEISDEVMETWNMESIKTLTDTAHKASFKNQQHQIDMLVTIINEFTEESTTQVKAIDHIVNRLDKIENFLDQISREVEKDNNVDRIVH
tara:strand:+ start:209 stop:514 length:306 start_codon:yes stop_codon:yes gene_type:complete